MKAQAGVIDRYVETAWIIYYVKFTENTWDMRNNKHRFWSTEERFIG